MSTRSRKRHSKKKHAAQAKKVLEGTKTDDTPITINDSHVTSMTIEDDKETPKNRFLDIIVKITKQLQLGNDLTQLLTVTENLSAISKYSSKKRQLASQILLNIASNLDDYDDEEELKTLKKNLESKFLTPELRKLIVAKNSMKASPFFGFLGKGRYGVLIKGYLKTPDNSKLEVVVKVRNQVYNGERIFEEAKIMSKLDHKNVLKILAFEKDGPKFAVEYMTLGNLEEALFEYDFSESKLLDVLRDVAAGMQYISKKGYLHRDLNISNILLDSNGECKISGFELCQYVGDSKGVYEDKEMDKNNCYLSPETKISCKFTVKTDVWAMGLLAWMVYVFAKRIKGKDIGELLILLITGIRTSDCDCPLALRMYLNEMVMNKDPKKRPTFGKIKKKLDELRNEL